MDAADADGVAAGRQSAQASLPQEDRPPSSSVNLCYRPPGFTALHCAANLRLPRLAGALLASGAAVDAPTRDVSKLTEPGGRTPLHLAAAAGGSAIVGMLLSAGADRSAEDWQGATPFLLACRRGHHAIAQQLAAAAVAERSRSGGQGGDGAEAEEREEDDGGEEVRMPLEQELAWFEMLNGDEVRAFVDGAVYRDRIAATQNPSSRNMHASPDAFSMAASVNQQVLSMGGNADQRIPRASACGSPAPKLS